MKIGGNEGKWGIHEQIQMEIYARTSRIWGKWGKIAEGMDKNWGVSERNAKDAEQQHTCGL